MTGIIGYEESQTVTIAFRERGHTFVSCDKQPCSGGHKEWHIQDDIYKVMRWHQDWPYKWDFVGLHPVCTLLANSGVRWLASTKPKEGFSWWPKYNIYINKKRYVEMKKAAEEFKQCLEWVKNAGKGYVENPIMHKYAAEIVGMKPTQIVHPYMFGHTTSKATCLWIFGLPNLQPTNIINKEQRTKNTRNLALSAWSGQAKNKIKNFSRHCKSNGGTMGIIYGKA